MDPSAESVRLNTSNFLSFGPPKEPSYLASKNQTWGNLRQTAFTRPQPSPAFYPPERNASADDIEKAKYSWEWPERPERKAAPQIKKAAKVEQSFLEEYELRPPWLKY